MTHDQMETMLASLSKRVQALEKTSCQHTNLQTAGWDMAGGKPKETWCLDCGVKL